MKTLQSTLSSLSVRPGQAAALLILGGLLAATPALTAQDRVVFTVGGDKAAGKAAAQTAKTWTTSIVESLQNSSESL